MILINQLVYVVIGPSSFRAATFPSTRGRHRVGVSVGVRRDGRHGTSVSLSRRVVTHHLSARTDRFFVGCVFVFTSTARRADARSRPSISPIEACAPTLASSRTATVEGPTATATTLDDARGGGEKERRREKTRGPSRSNPRERARIESIESNASNASNESIESIGRTVDDRSIESNSFIRAFVPIHPSVPSEEERRRREV